MFSLFKKNEVIEKPRTVVIDNKVWFVGSDVGKILEYKNLARSVQDHCNPDGIKTDSVLTAGGRQNMLIINEPNVKLLLARCQTKSENEKQDIINKFFPELESSFVFSRKETEFVSCLKECLDCAGIKVEFQKRVLSYRIDAYLPKYKLAIEFDENYHNSQKEQDAIRQKAIQKELNCSFVRLPENNTAFQNIGLILKQIAK